LRPHPLVAGQNSETAHRTNLSAVMRALHDHGPLSQSELGWLTGLTRSTIGALVREFVAGGFVSESPSTSLGNPGRPSRRVRLEPRSAVVLALEVSVDSVAAACVGVGGDVLEIVRAPRHHDGSSVDRVVADLHALAAGMATRPLDDPNLIGIGVGIAGLVRREDGLVAVAPNMDWRNVHLVETIAREFDTSVPIRVGNQADLAALAESRRGVAVDARHVVFVGAEVGVGGGLIVDGMPVRGALGYGGEVGHMPLNPTGRPCRCGSSGCWETEAGQASLLTRAGRDPGTGLDGVLAVLDDARRGDPRALRALDEVAVWIARGVATLINVLNPELVVLSGLFGRIHPFVAERVDREIDRLTLPAARAAVRVVASRLGTDAPLLGAAEAAFEPFLADPADWLVADNGRSRNRRVDPAERRFNPREMPMKGVA
jgi:predicted NBD/HSP70 family sugar kinase